MYANDFMIYADGTRVENISGTSLSSSEPFGSSGLSELGFDPTRTVAYMPPHQYSDLWIIAKLDSDAKNVEFRYTDGEYVAQYGSITFLAVKPN